MDSSEEAWREVEGLRENLKELREGVEGLLKERGLGNANSAASTLTINAGGVGVWIAATCCAIMLAITLGLTAMLIDHSRQIGRMQDHLTAIYMMAPHPKPDQDLKNSP